MIHVMYSFMILFVLLFAGCADAGKDQDVNATTQVFLDGSASTPDVRGKITQYMWKQVRGEKVTLLNKNTVKPSFIAPHVTKPSELVFKLSTIEEGGSFTPWKTYDRVKITIQPLKIENSPPIAVVEVNATSIKPNEVVTFNASGSSDIDGDTLKYEWTDAYGNILSEQMIFTHSFENVGIHTITLKVIDEQAMHDTTTVVVTINPLKPPIAVITVNTTNVVVGEEVVFDASDSHDSDGTIEAYRWIDDANHTLSNNKNFTHSFEKSGEKVITLVVTDNDSLEATAKTTIIVETNLKTLTLLPKSLELEANETAMLNVTASYEDGTSINVTSNTTWLLADETLLSIDDNGTLKALKVGSTTIKAKIDSIESNEAVVHIILPPDTLAPVITLNGAANITLNQNETYVELGATAIDERDGNVSVAISGNVDTSTIGTYTITYTTQDIAGNSSSKKRTINVVLPPDTMAPVITLNGAANITLNQNETYIELGATAIDDRDGNVSVAISGNVDTATVGTYTITYAAIDTAGNGSNITRTINVVLLEDTTPPIITLNGEADITIIQGDTYTELGAIAVDDRDGNISVVISGDVNTSIVATYAITYTAQDTAKNKAIATRTISVIKNEDDNGTLELVEGDYQFPSLKNDLIHIRVNPFGAGSYWSNKGNIDFDSDRNMSENYIYDYFTKSDEKLIITATPKNNTKIRAWIGCDAISTDKTECSVDLNTSHEVTPIFEYKEVITIDNLYHLTAAKNVTYDWNATTQLDGNGTLKVTLDDSNITLINNLSAIAVGDYINYSNPERSFLRKVEKIQKIDNLQYEFICKEVPLTEVIKQGTIYIEVNTQQVKPAPQLKNSKLRQSLGDSSSETITGDGYSATGSSSYTTMMQFALSITNLTLESVAFDLGGGLNVSLSGFADKSGGGSKKLLSGRIDSPSFFIVGPFRIFPNISAKSNINVSATAKNGDGLGASVSANVDGSFNVGYHYNKLTGARDYSDGKGSAGKAGKIMGEGSFKVSLPLNVSLGFRGYFLPLLEYGKITGEVGITASPFVELKAKCNQCVGRGIGNWGVEASIVGKVEAGLYSKWGKFTVGKDFSKNIFEKYEQFYNKKLSSCTTNSNNNSGTAPHGLFTATLSWGNPAAELSLGGGLMNYQGKTCTSYSIGSGNLTLYGVYPGHYPISVSATDTKYVANNEFPDAISIAIATPGEGKTLQATIGSRDAYDLGHVADVYIWRPKPKEPPVVIPIPAPAPDRTIYYNGTNLSTSNITWTKQPSRGTVSSSVSTGATEVRNIEKKLCTPAESCGCKPCEYSVISYLTQANLGPISGGTYRIYKATEFGKKDIEYLYEGETTIGDDIDTAGIMKLPVVVEGKAPANSEEAEFMQKIQGYNGDFIIEVSGGLDIDVNDDWIVDDNYTPLNGTIHAIISRKQLLRNEYKVNILTELSFQVSQDLLGDNYDRYQMENRLNNIAQKVLIEKLYPQSSNALNRDDIVYWLPSANKNWLIKDYAADLHPIVMKVHHGEYIGDDAYEFIYGDIAQSVGVQNNPNPILGGTWFRVDENVTGVYYFGTMKVLSEGNSSIVSYYLDGDSSDKFSIDESGEIYLVDGASLNYESKNYYDLFVTASNSEGTSRPVMLRVLLNDIPDTPTFVEFQDGNIPENAKEGDYVGKVIFNENKAPIVGYTLAGPAQDDFTIDNDGIIRVTQNADLDYETFYGKSVSVTARNSYGNSISTNIIVYISDVLDVPSIESLRVHVMENTTDGTLVAELNISSLEPIENITLLGDDNQIFDINTNGEIRVANGSYLDYETTRDYIFSVVATNVHGLSRPASFHVIIDNENDVPTLAMSKYRIHYNAPENTLVGKIKVSNEGSSVITSFQLEGEGSENFRIDNTGNIFVKTNNNLEQYQRSTFYFIVTASNDSGNSLPQRISIAIDSDRPFLGELRTYVDENVQEGVSLGAIPIVSSPTDIISMRLTGGGSEYFVIEKDGTIKVAPNATVDYEQVKSFDLTAYATNSAGESNGAHIHIRVYDMPDTIKIKGFGSTIYEDSDVGSLVGIVRIPSLGGHTFSHFKLEGEGSENFTIFASGEVKIASQAQFNHASTPRFHLAVVAVDNNGNESNKVYLDIAVAKSINTVPQITALPIDIPEDTGIGSTIGKIQIISRTKVVEKVWFEGEGSDDFEIDTHGVIKVKQNLDFEIKQQYELKAFAQNALGVSQPTQFIINIINVIDTIPVIKLKGSPTITVYQGESYLDEGAIAFDDLGKDITSNIQISNSVDTSKVGIYTIIYTVSDRLGNEANPITRTVTVIEKPNQPPIVDLGSDITTKVNQETLFHAITTDTDGTIVRYEWKLNNDIVTLEPSYTFTPTKTGNYIVTLTVIDDDGAIASDTLNIEVILNNDINLTKGLVAHYKCNGDTNDSSGNNNDGIIHGDLTYVDGIVNQACSFNGIDSYIEINQNETLNPTTQLTLSVWLHIDSSLNEWSPIIHKGGEYIDNPPYFNREYTLWYNKANFFHLASAGDSSTQKSFNTDRDSTILNTWHLYTAVLDRENHTVRIYLDGHLLKEFQDNYSSFNTNGDSLLLGWTEEVSSSYSHYNGKMDDIRIYDRALSSVEINELYRLRDQNNNSSDNIDAYSLDPFNDASLLHFYPFDGNATDLVGNANGTNYGMTFTVEDNIKYITGNGFSQRIVTPKIELPHTYTVTAWIRRNVTDGHYYFPLIGSNYNHTYSLSGYDWFINLIDAGNLAMRTAKTSSFVEQNKWSFVVFTMDIANNTMMTSVDAQNFSSVDLPQRPEFNIINQIGGFNGFSSTYGKPLDIDHLQIFNRALTKEEITKLYRATKKRNANISLPEPSHQYLFFKENPLLDTGNMAHNTNIILRGANIDIEKNVLILSTYSAQSNPHLKNMSSAIQETMTLFTTFKVGMPSQGTGVVIGGSTSGTPTYYPFSIQSDLANTYNKISISAWNTNESANKYLSLNLGETSNFNLEPISPGDFISLALVANQHGKKLYINSILVDSDTFPIDNVLSYPDLGIGQFQYKDSYNEGSKVEIGEIRFFDINLTEEQIRYLHKHANIPR